MPRAKATPVHNPEKFRRHLNQALFHLGLAGQQAILLEGSDNARVIVAHMAEADSRLIHALNVSKVINPPIGQDVGEQEEEG